MKCERNQKVLPKKGTRKPPRAAIGQVFIPQSPRVDVIPYRHDGPRMPARQLDGSIRCKDGSVVALDGTVYPPGWPAPRLLNPIFRIPKVRPGGALLLISLFYIMIILVALDSSNSFSELSSAGFVAPASSGAPGLHNVRRWVVQVAQRHDSATRRIQAPLHVGGFFYFEKIKGRPHIMVVCFTPLPIIFISFFFPICTIGATLFLKATKI